MLIALGCGCCSLPISFVKPCHFSRRREAEDLQERVASLEAESSDLEDEIMKNQELQEKLEAATSELSAANNQVRDLKEELSNLESSSKEKIGTLAREISLLEGKAATTEAEVLRLSSLATALSAEKEAVERELEANVAAFEALKQRDQEKSEAISGLEGSRDQLQAQLSEAEKRISRLESDLDTLDDIKQCLAEEKVEAEALAESLKASNEASRADFERYPLFSFCIRTRSYKKFMVDQCFY